MKHVDMTNVQEAGEFKKVEAGPYICVITNVEDVPDKEYLKVTYDIAAGELTGYYNDTRAKFPDWAWCGAYVKSYKPKALPMFKRFCSAISKSNGNFVFDGGSVNADEKTLIGKKLGIVFQEEEYYGNDGNIKTRLIVNREFPIDKLTEQKVPKRICLEEEPATNTNTFTTAASEEVPF